MGMEFGRGDCMNLCMSTLGCEGIQFQYTAGDDEDSIAKGACILLGGGCSETNNNHWELHSLVTETDYEKTSTPVPGDDDGGGGHLTVVSTITVTTTKRPHEVVTNHRGHGSVVVFVNEIIYHSDNPTVPGVEIAGPDNTDLSKYTIYTYDMSGKVTNTVHLHGTILAEHQQDYGVKWFNIPCHKFTSVALARVATLIQFLSVLDHVTAVDPPASGSTSYVISLQLLDSDTQKSLQLYGRGQRCEDFTWHKRTKSEGIVNALQNFDTTLGV